MKAKLIRVLFPLLCFPLTAFAQQVAPQEKQQQTSEDPAAKEREEARKRLAEISKVQDNAQKRGLLEKYVQENLKAPNINEAYSRLLGTLYSIDPVKAIQLADELLARPRDPQNSLWKNAYTYKFLSLQKLKKDDEVKALGRKVFETESDPMVLRNAADFDKENNLRLYEKAIAERQKGTQKDAYPQLSDLHSYYARALGSKGRKDEAITQMSKAIELSRAAVAEAEALPQDDPKRRNLEGMRNNVAYLYRELASFLSDTGQHEKGLEALAQTEDMIRGSSRARELRPSIEETRAKIYANLGKSAEALDSYSRSFAYRMTLETRDKIRDLAKKIGKPADEYFSRSRQLREASAEPFKPFDLKTHEGTPSSLDSLKGKITLVNFFFPT